MYWWQTTHSTRLTWRPRHLGTDVALVISGGVFLLADQTDPAEAEPWMDTWVLSRDGGSWQVASFHTCPEHA